MHVSYNASNAGKPLRAAEEIEDLIGHYYHCGDGLFIDFAQPLSKYKEPILDSFVMIEKNGPGGLYDCRLSNDPIESTNRKIRDLKRLGRGFRNFEHLRNRFLYAARNNPVFYGSLRMMRHTIKLRKCL